MDYSDGKAEALGEGGQSEVFLSTLTRTSQRTYNES